MSFTLEAIISGFVIVTFLLFFFSSPVSQDTYETGLLERGHDCLKGLDESGLLREDAMEDNTTGIEDNLEDCLAGLNYNVSVCRSDCTASSLPENQTVVVASYFIAGHVEADPLYVKLNMWLQ